MTLPEKVTIQFRTEDGEPFRHENILVGIQTFAERKNDINLSPFMSDKNGTIEIAKSELKATANDFISYGIMDYLGIESVRDNIEIYLWTQKEIKKEIDYWAAGNKADIETDVRNNPIYKMSSKQKEQLIRDFKEIRVKENKRLDKFKKAFNDKLLTKFTTRVTDKWDGRQNEYQYIMTIKLK
jgi:hypothetical protein